MNDTTVSAMIMSAWWANKCENIRSMIITGCGYTYRPKPHQWFLPMHVGVGVN